MSLNKVVSQFIEKEKGEFNPQISASDYRRAINQYIADADQEYKKNESHFLTEQIAIYNVSDPNSIPIKIYRPEGRGPFSALIYIMGSGFVHDDLNWQHRNCFDLAAKNRCVVFAVSGRVAPEYPFPTGLNDCFNVVKWIFANTTDLGVDKNKIGLVGFSSGGNFAAVIARWALTAGCNFKWQFLISPWLDLTCSFDSYKKYEKGFLLDKPVLDWLKKQYLSEADINHPDISPIKASDADLKGLSETIIISAECEPFYDENVEYVNKLKKAGVRAVHHTISGQIHEFFGCYRWLLTRETEDPVNIITRKLQSLSSTLNMYNRSVTSSLEQSAAQKIKSKL